MENTKKLFYLKKHFYNNKNIIKETLLFSDKSKMFTNFPRKVLKHVDNRTRSIKMPGFPLIPSLNGHWLTELKPLSVIIGDLNFHLWDL